MSATAIRIHGLSKSYRIRHERGNRPTNIREAISDKLCNPFEKASHEDFWALKGIDLEINKGDVVGVIGRNGAGKSTLLKVLSRITEPTTGKVELFGRVGSLLEVGTGFHPELTGRENIYLNGAILGMRRSEITSQFDAIVDFAGVERFLDTPVKRYSSGMYVRLAFAVAAHLNPEILIVDEVLAVGDAEFQKKCLGKMQDVAESGRTVLFVSHNMAAVQTLCRTTVVLRKGSIGFIGNTATAIEAYNITETSSKVEFLSDQTKDASIRAIKVCSRAGSMLSSWDVTDSIYVVVDIEINRPFRSLDASIRLESAAGVYITTAFASRGGVNLNTLDPGLHSLEMKVHMPSLLPGRYNWSVWLHEPMRQLYDFRESAISIEATNSTTSFSGLGSAMVLGHTLADNAFGLRQT